MKKEHEVENKCRRDKRTIFGKNSTVKALIFQEEDGKPIGYAVYFYNYSTWLGKMESILKIYISLNQKRGKNCWKSTF